MRAVYIMYIQQNVVQLSCHFDKRHFYSETALKVSFASSPASRLHHLSQLMLYIIDNLSLPISIPVPISLLARSTKTICAKREEATNYYYYIHITQAAKQRRDGDENYTGKREKSFYCIFQKFKRVKKHYTDITIIKHYYKHNEKTFN
jgi:hypothetical protein